MGKLDFIKIKNFCAPKDIIKSEKGQHTEWQKIFVNHISDRLVSNIYEELLQLNSNPKNVFKMVKEIDISPEKIYRWPLST